MNLDQLAVGFSAETEAEKFFIQHCTQFGLDPNLLHSKIYGLFNAKTYRIVGMSKKGRAYYILLQECGKDDQYVFYTDIRTLNTKFTFELC